MKNRKLLSVLLLLSPSLMMAQDNAKGILNQFLSDWLLPVFVLFVIGGIIHGIVKNGSVIADSSEEGNMVKGFLNMGKILAFYVLAFAVLVAVVAGANAVITSIQIQ